MFFQIRVFRELGRYGLARVINYAYFSRGKKIYATLATKMAEVVRNRLRAWINEILQQLASPNLDSDSHESVFYRVETLYNTVVRFDGVRGIGRHYCLP